MSKKTLSDFQKSFLSRGVGNTLFTQKEFDDALAQAKAEIMTVAIETTKKAIYIEREACAKLAIECSEKIDPEKNVTNEEMCLVVAQAIRNRIPGQVNK